MICLLKILDNTFIGTVLAGVLLACFGLYLYRRQKSIDYEYEDLRQLKEVASVLFGNVVTAAKNYEAQLNLHDGKNPQLKWLSNILNEKSGNHFQKEFDKDFNSMISKITLTTDNLIAKLKVNHKYEAEIKILLEKIPTLNFYLLGASVLHLSKPEQIEEYRKGFNEILKSIESILREIINHKT